MLRSSNDQTQNQSFTIKVKQRPDGRFEATSPNAPKVPPTVANSLQVASAQHGDRLHELHKNGKL
jgi:hypothetical protein